MHLNSIASVISFICVSFVLAKSKEDGRGRSEYPSFPENAICALTNAARYDLLGYIKKYPGAVNGGANCDKTAAVPSVYFSKPLLKAARRQSQQIVKCFEHETCDKSTAASDYGGDTSMSARMKYFVKQEAYDTNLFYGENIAKGTNFNDPLAVTGAFIESRGHCNVLMGEKFDKIGVHERYDSRSRLHYVAEAFSSTASSEKVNERPKLVCGGHLKPGLQSKQDFVVSVSTNNADFKIQVVVNEKPFDMNMDIGSQMGAMYRLNDVDLSSVQCNRYRFTVYSKSTGKLVDSYPENGVFTVRSSANGNQKCEEGFSKDMYGSITKATTTPEALTPSDKTILSQQQEARPQNGDALIKKIKHKGKNGKRQKMKSRRPKKSFGRNTQIVPFADVQMLVAPNAVLPPDHASNYDQFEQMLRNVFPTDDGQRNASVSDEQIQKAPLKMDQTVDPSPNTTSHASTQIETQLPTGRIQDKQEDTADEGVTYPSLPTEDGTSAQNQISIETQENTSEASTVLGFPVFVLLSVWACVM